MSQSSIEIRGARQNNLKGIDVDIPLGKMTVITGPSGSGKSSLAFQTLYAEGQRRYVETFSPYTRQFFDRMDKPRVDAIRGIPPAIAIEQVNNVRTTRSTVGTITEINDYLKLLFPRVATGRCPSCGKEVRPETTVHIVETALTAFAGQSLLVTFPVAVPPKVVPSEFFSFLQEQGFLRIHAFGETYRTDDPSAYPKKTLPSRVLVIQDRIVAGPKNRARLHEAVENAARLGKGSVTLIDAEKGTLHPFSRHWHCAGCDIELREPVPGLFSFNSALGACPSCRGFGKTIGVDYQKAIPDESLTLAEGAVKAFAGETYSECQDDLMRCARRQGIPLDVPYADLDEEQRAWVINGEGGDPEELYAEGNWYGLKGFFRWMETRSYKMHVRVFLSRFRSYTDCEDCGGGRLIKDALCYHIGGKILPELWRMPVSRLATFLADAATEAVAADAGAGLALKEVVARLRYLEEVGLGYLTLDRSTRTLSGGEVARVNLTTCLGASLTNALFVLDEPSIGLHPRDVGRLLRVMHALRDRGNTLAVVEHDASVMEAADHLIDLGPGRGAQGGELILSGSMRQLLKGRSQPDSLTLDYLTGRKTLEGSGKRRKPRQWLTIRRATHHNLKKIDVKIPLGVFTCVTGVSGSGKSTLVHKVLYENLARLQGKSQGEEPGRCARLDNAAAAGEVIMVDQSPVARTPRSCPAVFIGAFDAIRKWFAQSAEAKERGVDASYFSFNSGGGRCARCAGNGFEKIEMQFLSDLYVTCPECEGRRYHKETLKITREGRSIADVLEMSVGEAVTFFEAIQEEILPAAIVSALQPLAELGLDYLRLGQPLNTLSGGESQRLKLVSHLIQLTGKSAAPCFLLCDEPTTGLHFDDIRLLLSVFQRLVEAGHSLLVIEHNLDVIRSADWVIDLGPEAGEDGGLIVAEGTPETVALCAGSHTGRWLSGAARAEANEQLLRVAEEALSYGVPTNHIQLKGAREHNLKNIDVSIPRDQFVVITGLSGSGKSTLAFDILFAEGQRRFLDSMSPYARQFAEQMEKPDIDAITGLPPTVAIEQRVSQGGGKSTVATVTEVWHFLRLLFAKVGTQYCPSCHVPVQRRSVTELYEEVARAWKKDSLRVLAPVIKGRKGYHTDIAAWAVRQGFRELLVDGKLVESEAFVPLARYQEHDIDAVILQLEGGRGKKILTEDIRTGIDRALEVGKGEIRLLTNDGSVVSLSTEMSCGGCGRSFEELDPRLFSYNSPHGWCPDCRGYGWVKSRMVLDLQRAESHLDAEVQEESRMERAEEEELQECATCHGDRLCEAARHVKVEGLTPGDLGKLTATTAGELIHQWAFEGRNALVARDIVPEITQRLAFMKHVGLGYLQLNRHARTLSGGEAQRIRLAAQLGSNLRGVLYVLDEPTIGLHPRDNVRLLDTLEALRERGNSLLVVEHDDETMRRATHIIDMGPGAGKFGGEIIAQGTWDVVSQHPGSSTGRHLREPMPHPLRGQWRSLPQVKDPKGWIVIKGARANNLKACDIDLPLGCLTVLTGVSGAGKSSLLHGVIKPAAQVMLAGTKQKSKAGEAWKSVKGFENIAAVYEVDQSPIGKTSRSTPGTYIKVFDEIRKLFAAIPEARMRGFDAGRFSFNNEGGRCEVCGGNGMIKHEMAFLPTSHVLCEACRGSRYNAATLEVEYQGKNIGQIMDMTIDEAADFFAPVPRVARPLRLLRDTGCGYLRLGQPSPTLSGGEAQRVKLVTELTKGVSRSENAKMKGVRDKKSNLYLIEEPTIGLHMEDVRKLLDVLHRLVDDGHTVIVIEHHLDVIAEADHVIDIGPEAGADGGTVVAKGTPAEIAVHPVSRIAPFLHATLAMKTEKPKAKKKALAKPAMKRARKSEINPP